MLPWIVLTAISMIFDLIQVIGFIVWPATLVEAGGHIAPDSGVAVTVAIDVSICLCVIYLAIGCYIFIVVWSFRFLDVGHLLKEIPALNLLK